MASVVAPTGLNFPKGFEGAEFSFDKPDCGVYQVCCKDLSFSTFMFVDESESSFTASKENPYGVSTPVWDSKKKQFTSSIDTSQVRKYSVKLLTVTNVFMNKKSEEV